MNLLNLPRIIMLMPSAYRHISTMVKMLKENSIESILSKDIVPKKAIRLETMAKAYFWCSRMKPKEFSCLPRSLALFRALKSCGFDARHKIGVNKSKGRFAAHAWVEVNQYPINENAESLKNFQAIKEYSAYKVGDFK